MLLRHLGFNGDISTILHAVDSPVFKGDLLAHVEGTDASDATSPTIGHGVAKVCRDVSMIGYAVGRTIDSPSIPPFLIEYRSNHILCYDIECEYAGPACCSLRAPILCVSLVCSCGWKQCVSRRDAYMPGNYCHVRHTNLQIAELTMALIISHKPIFTVGHNVYGYDNKVLALALGSKHTMSKYFKQIMRSDASTMTDFGLIMVIPGINNLDTYRFIRQSMFGTFKTFSLDALCKANDIPTPKTQEYSRVFSEEWYMESSVNAKDMIEYNMRDCIATIALCEKLDIVNQIVCLSYTANAWIEDVLLYNTGAIATSSLCNATYSKGYRFMWTRCDWRPKQFRGGELIYCGPVVASNVMVVDFVSMYPTIMASCGISPESIDYVTPSYSQSARFTSLGIAVMVSMIIPDLMITVIVYGVMGTVSTSMRHRLIIAEKCAIFSSSIWLESSTRRVAMEFIDKIRSKDQGVRNTRVDEYIVFDNTCNYNIPQYIHDRILRLHDMLKQRRSNTEWMWVPNYVPTRYYAVDWIVSMDGYSTIVRAPEYEAHFTHGTNTASSACKELMDMRKVYKTKMKTVMHSEPSVAAAYDKVQYALKICANSMYGALSYGQYNTYSPRCGMSVTAIGRWALSVKATIICRLGFDVVYGDTDSVMFGLPTRTLSAGKALSSGYYRPIMPYIQSLILHTPNKRRDYLCEYLSGAKGSISMLDHRCMYAYGLIPKLVNRVLSYSCLSQLCTEHQPTGACSDEGIENCVLRRFMIMQKKHYIALKTDGTKLSKGVSYVRRSGCELKDEAMRRFSDIVLTYPDMEKCISRMVGDYKYMQRMVIRADPIHIFKIRTTVRGVPGTYLKISHPSPSYIPCNEFNSTVHQLDFIYYQKILVDAATTVCVCMGLPDANAVTAGMGLIIHGV